MKSLKSKKKMKRITNRIYRGFIGVLFLAIMAFTSCQKDDTFKNLEATFEVDKTEVEVGEEVVFTITGTADYFVIFTGEPNNPFQSVDADEFIHTYDVPGSFEVKLLASSVDQANDFEVKRDSAFLTINVTDNELEAHTKFSAYTLTLTEFAGFEDHGYTMKSVGVVDGYTVTVNVPNSTVITNLKAYFGIEPYSTAYVNGVQQSVNITTNDFTQPVTYTVVANDGTQADNVVTVVRDPKSDANELTELTVNSITEVVYMDGNNINIAVPEGSDVDSLVIKFELPDFARAYINDVEVISGISENDFTSPVTLTVVAEDGTENDYLVTILSDPIFTSFYFPDLAADSYITNIDNNKDTVFVMVQPGILVINLNTGFTTSPANAVVTIDGVTQSSENAYVDFTDPVTYTITNGAIENSYVVSISEID
jgi:hypothetical protein